jgi:histidinol-phosphate aminotransferase
MEFKIENLLRTHLHEAPQYRSARDEFQGEAQVFLDANENPNESDFNRYPDPLATNLRKRLAQENGLEISQIALGNGSDEWIDMLFRLFAEPGKDAALMLQPSYGMYRVSSALNKVKCLEIPLNTNWDIDLNATLEQIENERVSLVFLCSPNNPTGNLLDVRAIEVLLRNSQALVIIDEAYVHFSAGESWLKRLGEFPNLLVLQTFSKALGLAALRIGVIYGNPKVIAYIQAFKAPYNLNYFSQQKALQCLEKAEWKKQCEETKNERDFLRQRLEQFPFVERVFPSQANFLLIQFNDAQGLFQYLKNAGIIVRDRSSEVANALRISIGTPSQNRQLLKLLEDYEN